MQLIARALAMEGVSVTIATTDDDGPGRRLRAADFELGEEWPALIHRFAKQSEFYKCSWPLLRWLRKNVRGYDLVHVHALFSFPSVVGAWTARAKRVPYIIRPIGVLERYGLTMRRPAFKSLSLRIVEKPLLRDAAAVQFTSEREREQARGLGLRMNSVVVPLGVAELEAGNKEAFLRRHPVARKRRRILFLSRIDPKKNIESLIRAMSILARKGDDSVLFLAGAGSTEYVESLNALVKTERVAESIVWLGHVVGPAKADALAIADLFVLPSFSENFGMAAAEALAAGVPCVLGRGVAMANDVETAGAGIAVDPTPEAIASGIGALLRDDARRHVAGLAAKTLAEERYSIRRMGADLLALYERIVNGGITRNA